MAEPDCIEGKTGELALAGATVGDILEAQRIAKSRDVHEHVRSEQHTSGPPKQRDLPRAMPGNVNDVDASGDGQGFAVGQRLVDADWRQALVRIVEHPAEYLRQQAGRRRHRPERTTRGRKRDVERMHIRSCAGFPHDRGGAADMVGMTVR